jgi:hypothetical protein
LSTPDEVAFAHQGKRQQATHERNDRGHHEDLVPTRR